MESVVEMLDGERAVHGEILSKLNVITVSFGIQCLLKLNGNLNI